MKFALLIILFSSQLVFADLEHKDGQGTLPEAQKLTLSRGCFKEIKSQGCGHPRENQDFFSFCLQLKLEALSSDCQGFFTKLYGKRI